MAKKPDQATIDAIRADAKSGLSVEQVRLKNNVGWMTAKKYIDGAGDKKSNTPPAKRLPNQKPRGGFDGALEELRSRRDALNRAIEALEAV